MGFVLPPQLQGGVDTSTPYSCPITVSVRDLVYSSGVNSVDKADADDAGKRPAVGFVRSKPSTTTCIVQYDGELTGFVGLTASDIMYMSETAGAITATAPTASGSSVQEVAFARNATTIAIEIGELLEL